MRLALAGVRSQRMPLRFVSHRRAFADRPCLPSDQLDAPRQSSPTLPKKKRCELGV